MEQVRLVLAELTADPAVADILREDPLALGTALDLTQSNVEALLDVERFFDTEKAIVDHLVGGTDDPLASVAMPPALHAAAVPGHDGGYRESVVAVVANVVSVALKAIESLEAMQRRDHGEHVWPDAEVRDSEQPKIS
jgi:hypothetical protein